MSKQQLLDTDSKHPFSWSALADKSWHTLTESAFRAGLSPLERLAESAVVALMERIVHGQLRVLTFSHIYVFGNRDGDDGGPKAELRVVNNAFWIRLCTMGDLGFSEAYMYGDVECDDLVSLFDMFLLNRDELTNLDSRLSFLFTIPQRLTSYRFLNSLSNTRSNISAHYDISNTMFAGFLSEDMTYSCAIFSGLDEDCKEGLDQRSWSGAQSLTRIGNGHSIKSPSSNPANEDELYEAQIRKLRHIITKARIESGHRVLEIGSGWGSMAILICQTYSDVTVDTLTLSVQQQALARQRIEAAGFKDRITVHLMDYRAMPAEWEGAFDRVVSVEMIEAVGKEFLDTYFARLDWALNLKTGVGVIQVITIPEARFERYMQEIDFIRKWIFPGGFLPTLTLLMQTLEKGSNGKLIVDSVSNIGPHYARTLREWRKRFLASFNDIVIPALKKDYPDVMCGPRGKEEIEVFRRKWLSAIARLALTREHSETIFSRSLGKVTRILDVIRTSRIHQRIVWRVGYIRHGRLHATLGSNHCDRMQHFTKGAIRVAKNYTKGYSDTQSKVRESTSNDPWGPSGTQMNEIAQLTYNQQDFVEIMEMLDKRLNDKGKNWRHVFKSLTLLDYCLHQGSENVVLYFRDNIYVVKTLKEFQYIDEEGKDQGSNVRQKAKDISNLLTDESRLRQERRTRASMRDRMVGGAGEDGEGDFDENSTRRNGKPKRSGREGEDDLRKAIEESKRSLAIDTQTAEERDLAQAIALSEEEESKRRKDVEDSNANSLFDDATPAAPPQSNNPFPFVDPTPYAVGLQPQPTYQLQPQFTSMQPQFTNFNPYQQQMEQERAQAEYMQQQAIFQQQQQQAAQEQWMREQMIQQQMLQQQQQQQQQGLFAQQPLTAQPTGFGSKNPFAPSPQPNGTASPPPPLPTQQQPPSFNLGGTYDNRNNAPDFTGISQQQQPQQQQTTPQPQDPRNFKVKPKEGENEHLATLFANRDDGQDTFGNLGNLRYGHQHASTFVASQKTGGGHNPFALQQQQEQQQQQQQQQQRNGGADQPFFSI